MGGVRVLAAGGRLKQPQSLPCELGQVRGTDVTAALSLRATRRQLVKKQSGEARVLGEEGTKGQRDQCLGARTHRLVLTS